MQCCEKTDMIISVNCVKNVINSVIISNRKPACSCDERVQTESV